MLPTEFFLRFVQKAENTNTVLLEHRLAEHKTSISVRIKVYMLTECISGSMTAWSFIQTVEK